MKYIDNLDKLIEIAHSINAKNLETELVNIKGRAAQPNAELIFPLVGEFSSGKTTLINALTDSRKLETAVFPTTATIYEVHFGCSKCFASVVNSDGEVEVVEDIAELKNSKLADAPLVNVYDTSTRIPSSTILVDTPGLSSTNPKHRQTLVDFLPLADGILLVTDVNQQITRSLTDFIETMKLSKRPIYLVITKCDTKSPTELDDVKRYISTECKLPIEQVACVSATTGDMDELYAVLDAIQKDKNRILAQVNEQRIKNISEELVAQIDDLLKSSDSDEKLDEAIGQQERELMRLNRSIDKLIDDAADGVVERGKEIRRHFEDILLSRLEKLVTSQCDNFDSAAVSLINNTASLLLEDYKSTIKELLRETARNNRNTEFDISLHSLTEMDLSGLTMGSFSYDLDLNNVGHEYDNYITAATKVAAVAATVASSGGTINVDSIVEGAKAVGTELDKLNKAASNSNFVPAGTGTRNTKDLVSSIVGLVTDEAMGKPERKMAIRNYMDGTLIPEFKRRIDRLGAQVTEMIGHTLRNEAHDLVEQRKEALNQLKKDRSEKRELFEQRVVQLRKYRNELVSF